MKHPYSRPLTLLLTFAMASTVWAGPSRIDDAGKRGSQEAANANPTCVAIVLPSVRGVEGDATAIAKSLREVFASFLTGPSLTTQLLDARLQAQAVEEAKAKGCGYVLTVTLTRKRSGGGAFGRVMGQAAQGAAWQVPYGGTVASAAARSAAIAGAYAVTGIAESTRAKDELRLDYRIAPPDAIAQADSKSETVKAKSDGEDLVTPLVERVAETVAGIVAKK